MSESDYEDPFGAMAGCYDCDGSGWTHGCCDDLCYASNDPEWCDAAYPCPTCNPGGELS